MESAQEGANEMLTITPVENAPHLSRAEPLASIRESADPTLLHSAPPQTVVDPLTRYAGMIRRAEANALPQTGRIVQPAGCLGAAPGQPAVCHRPNEAVRGAADILRYATGTNEQTLTLRESAANELRAMAAHYNVGGSVDKSLSTKFGSVDKTPTPAPKPYTGNRAKALAAMRAQPGYTEPEHHQRQRRNEAQEVGLF
ncbi:MAG: hypothetical protein H7Y38_05185 [Armatimonadetes bacterium]|nr:hypothetical protein [Armatimonadota bacterium]